MFQLPNPSYSLFLSVLSFILVNQRPCRTSLYSDYRENKVIKISRSGAMKKPSPSYSHKNQVIRSTHNHLDKTASQHPPPSLSLARTKSRAPPIATTSTKEESSHRPQWATSWRAEESSHLSVLCVISFGLLPFHPRASCSTVAPGLRQIDVRSPSHRTKDLKSLK